MYQAYVCLSLGDYIPAGQHAVSLLSVPDLPGGYKLLGHLYAAESLILQDRLAEAIKHLNPDNVTDVDMDNFPAGDCGGGAASGGVSGRAAVQYNLAVCFSLREEWEKAGSVLGQLYEGAREVPAQVVLLVLYLALRRGDTDMARRVVRDRCVAHRKGDEKQ